jgi:branched-chain amino acid transport system ATP-binding protein
MAGEIIAARNLTKRFGGLTAVDGISYSLYAGQAAGLIGPNGSGKTTFFNLLSGHFPPSAGSVFFEGQDITDLTPFHRVRLGMARTFQLVSVFSRLSAWENLVLPVVRFKEGEQGFRRFYLRSHSYRSLLEDCEQALAMVGLTSRAAAPTSELSYGDKRLLEIAMALALKPKLLLLDEPLAGLSDHEISEVMQIIFSLKGRLALIIIEHKISKITGLVESLCVMNEGRIICEGPADVVLTDPGVRECYWGSEESC